MHISNWFSNFPIKVMGHVKTVHMLFELRDKCNMLGYREKFKSKGNDECDGTTVTFDAPYFKTKLVGSWNANSINSGTFTAEKQ